MTTNQTIDGVPRADIEKIEAWCISRGWTGVARSMRALLDAPAPTTLADFCEACEKRFAGLDGSTKWCPYCGAKHEGETVSVSSFPAAQPQGDGVNWKAVANEQMGIIQALKAAQPQGEPVAWMYRREGGECLGQLVQMESDNLKDVREGKVVEGRRILWPREDYINWKPLYAEQPAPVAVTLQQVLAAYEYAESHPHKYLRGTTNWCAAVARSLNILKAN